MSEGIADFQFPIANYKAISKLAIGNRQLEIP
jgi:hypothetical protein